MIMFTGILLLLVLLPILRALPFGSTCTSTTTFPLQSKFSIMDAKLIACVSNSKTAVGSSTSYCCSTDTTRITRLQMTLRDSGSYSYSGSVRPGRVSPQRTVRDPNILLPDYALSGRPKPQVHMPWMPTVEIKTTKEIDLMRAAGRCAREVLDIAGQAVQPGITTDEIDALVHVETLKRGAYPSPLNYCGFPKSCCTSVNEIICHGIPDDRKLVEGDIINLDVTCYLNGYHGDCSEMFVVGDTDEKSKELIQVTYDCWIKAMAMVRPGAEYKDIGTIIEDYVTERGFSTVQRFTGHGIGSVFHTRPHILHYKNNDNSNGRMVPGHTFTVEPMICVGSAASIKWPDQWTAATQDGKRSAQFEHTLLVTETGVEPLTGKIPTSPIQFWEIESAIVKGIWLGTTG